MFHRYSSIVRQCMAAFSCQLGAIMGGTEFAWFSPIIVWLLSSQSEIPMTNEQNSWIISIVELGVILSPIPCGLLVNKIGAKLLILSTFPVSIIAWIMVISTRSVTILYITRILQGWCMGITSTVGPMYVAEISQPNIRGTLCGQFHTTWNIGTLYAYLTGPYLSYNNYAYVCMIFAFLFIATFTFMPETPYFYLRKSQYQQAENSLKWLRASEDVDEELQTISQSIMNDSEKKRSWKNLLATKADRKALLIVEIVALLKLMSGFLVISVYVSKMLTELFSNINSLIYFTPIIFGVISIITSLLGSYVSDFLGRRKLLIFSTSGVVIFNAVLAIYYFIHEKTLVDVSKESWIVLVCIFGICIVSNLGIGPLQQTLQAEFFSSHTRGIGGGVTCIVGTVAAFAVLKMYQPITDNVGVYMNYVIFTIFSSIGSIILWFIVPETAKKSLNEIEIDLGRNIDNSIHL